MRAFELAAEIDEQRRVQVVLPESAPPGPARALVLVPEDEEGSPELWMRGVAREWLRELADERENIYTRADGEPLDVAQAHG